MSKIALVSNASGTGTLSLVAPNTNSDRTLTLPDNSGTLLSNASTFAGTGPAFSAWKSVSQTITPATFTKMTLDVEEFDTNSCFDTSTSRFTPNIAGYYQFNFNVDLGGVTMTAGLGAIYKNGSQAKRSSGVFVGSMSEQYVQGAALIYMNGTTDYAELYGYIGASGNGVMYGGSAIQSFFQAALVRAA